MVRFSFRALAEDSEILQHDELKMLSGVRELHMTFITQHNWQANELTNIFVQLYIAVAYSIAPFLRPMSTNYTAQGEMNEWPLVSLLQAHRA